MTANLKLKSLDPATQQHSADNLEQQRSFLFHHLAWVGDNSFASRLLVDRVRQRTAFSSSLLQYHSLSTNQLNADTLYLLDYTRFSTARLTQLLAAASRTSQVQAALWNLESRQDCAEHLAWPGLKGVFYNHSSEQLLIKGIFTLATGGHWFTRDQLDLIASQRVSPADSLETGLTQREQALLRFLAQGKSNQMIADELNRSLHTVKTHLYNLYRKLGVGNRNQAVYWANRNHLL